MDFTATYAKTLASKSVYLSERSVGDFWILEIARNKSLGDYFRRAWWATVHEVMKKHDTPKRLHNNRQLVC